MLAPCLGQTLELYEKGDGGVALNTIGPKTAETTALGELDIRAQKRVAHKH